MIKIEHSVVVDRPVEEVFAYATDVSKVPEWQTSALEARVDAPMQAGATGAIVRKFLGRRMESTVRFDEYEPPRKFAIESTSGPVQFHVHQTYEPEGAGARINIVMEGEPGGFFKLAEPLVQRAIKREMEANFATLKDILEARCPSCAAPRSKAERDYITAAHPNSRLASVRECHPSRRAADQVELAVLSFDGMKGIRYALRNFTALSSRSICARRSTGQEARPN